MLFLWHIGDVVAWYFMGWYVHSSKLGMVKEIELWHVAPPVKERVLGTAGHMLGNSQ